MGKIGLVFDIQRCSLHDGPGIRTTVFLKGCPLRCLWCHNPESQSFKPELSYNAEKCVDCFECVPVCTEGAHKIVDGKHAMEYDLCKSCGNCVPACLYDALTLVGYPREIAEIMREVEADRAFYERSGGGLTISGGEPMAQFGFIKELLSTSKKKGIHTCIETCGFAGQEQYKEIMKLVDVFLFDYKGTNPAVHEELTGVDNKIILSNLDFLYRSGASIILRCPLIPGVNDSPEHLEGIAQLSARYPDLLGIEIMAYHDMGKDKAHRIGRGASLLDHLKTTSEEKKAEWLSVMQRLGADRVKIG